MAIREIRSYDDGFRVWHSRYVNMSFLAHWHDETELIYVRAGQAVLSVDDRTYTVSTGDLLLCPGGHIHYGAPSDLTNQLEFVVFDTGLLPTPPEPVGVQVFRHDYLCKTGAVRQIQTALDTVEEALRSRAPHYKDVVLGAVTLLYYRLRQLTAEQPPSLPADDQLIRQTLTLMKTHPEHDLTLETTARRVGVSTCYLSRIFKEHTGMTFVTYRSLLRLERAVELLHTTAMPVTEIASACGFQDVRTMNRVFQKHTGHTPSDFRRDLHLHHRILTCPHPTGETDTGDSPNGLTPCHVT